MQYMSFSEYVTEAFSDMGKLSDTELKKGQPLVSGDNFKKTDGRTFATAISKIKANDIARGDAAKGLDTLTIYSVREYNEMDCYLGDNNSSGYALHGDELVSVFSSQGSSGNAIMQSAIENGAKRLDCFAFRSETGELSGGLFKLYGKYGFKVDTKMNVGNPGEAYSVVNGISSYVDDNEVVHEDDIRVVIYMKR